MFESYLFMIIGNFITSAFTKDFTALELLRKPILFPGQKQGNFFLFKIPKGFPHTDLVLCIGERNFVSKVKDAALKSGLQNHDEKNNLLVVDATPIFSDYGNGENINIAKAVYFPWYRFVTEPVEFFKIEDVSTYVLKAIYYLTKVKGVDSQFVASGDFSEVKVQGVFDKGVSSVRADGKNQLNAISLLSGEEKTFESTLHLKERKITLHKIHSKLLFNAIETINKKNESLGNIEVKVHGDCAELIYIKD